MFETIVRLGYASKALVYAIVGGLAVVAALNRGGGRVTDTSGALRVILSQPFGHTLLYVLTAGLCGYALWRFVDAIQDPDRRGTDFGGLVTRIGNVVRGCVYGLLGVEAFRLARGLGGSNSNAEMWSARIMDWPGGVLLLAVVGGIVAAYGVSEVVRSIKGKVDETVDYSAIPAPWRQAAIHVSRFGIGARGLIIATLGIFLVRAALQHDPSEAEGTRGSILELANVVSGRWLLAAVAAGLIAYAVDQAIHACWRRIRPVV